MGITKSIGKNTLGGGNKMNVDLRTYNRSTHDLSYAWRSTMGVGTLVPCMCEVGLPGDTFDINIQQKILTMPTVGPLFGSFKGQIDIFTCPIRLYNAMLHNNMLNIGLDMKSVKLPQFEVEVEQWDLPNEENEWSQISPSSLLSYLGRKGFSGERRIAPSKKRFNAVPAIAYYDIFKNYYANKQEDVFYVINNDSNVEFLGQFKLTAKGYITNSKIIIENFTIEKIEECIFYFENKTLDNEKIENYFSFEQKESNVIMTYNETETNKNTLKQIIEIKDSNHSDLKPFKLEQIDEWREKILASGKQQVIIDGSKQTYLDYLIKKTDETRATFRTKRNGYGLCVKTYQSDIFNNWINTEWLDGDNGINAITAIDTSGGSFTIDTLNLSQKVYDMLNRIAVSGGSYKDWVETVYANNWQMQTETPVYEGGTSFEVVFQEVVSTNTGSDDALGTLAGRGTDANKKGGNLHIKINEPCYIIGIVSLTPRVDYSQGNAWDTNIQTLDDLHKPALDGIGFQDLMTEQLAWWKDDGTAVGKQPAWINYMTNFNKTFGSFARKNDTAFMCLNRFYNSDAYNYDSGDIDVTTYINPQMYNYIFAENTINSENFWVQIGMKIEARRVMSAKQIPNL